MLAYNIIITEQYFNSTLIFYTCGLLPNWCNLTRRFRAERRRRSGLVGAPRPWRQRVGDPILLKILRIWGLLHAKSYVVDKGEGVASSGVVLDI
ncbi:hypothetical protein AVEN_82283-1 [Araneus ventricosus]|uniref:Uncharacterized protein n=1 Tax=Araneus ventricosus TaxID=182803 RepID=A0A4Y2DXK4_ARAVE|nr:hypothetical protein AVEN_82283-1 [Araneus ventricosus]